MATLPELVSVLHSPYLDYIFRWPPAYVWCIFLLLMGRILPIFGIVPYLGGKLFPAPMKMGIAISWCLVLFPKVLNDSFVTQYLETQAFYLLLIKEVVIGCVIAFLLSIPFYAAQASGSFVTNQQGIQGMDNATAPISIEQSSPQGILYHYIVAITFWLMGGYKIVLSLLLQSIAIIPLETFIHTELLHIETPLWVTVLKIPQLFLIMTIQLGAPAIVAMLLSDLFLGIINRMAPQVQVIYLLSALKAFMGTLFMWLAWWFIMKQINIFTVAWFKQIPTILFSSHLLKP